MKTASLLAKLAKRYPKKMAEVYDHPGLQVGPLPSETNKILLCLDFDDEVYPAFLKEKPDLIITHHPFFFGKKNDILVRDPVKRDLYEKIEGKVAVLSYHTNFDNGNPGMNDFLARKLGLSDISPLPSCLMARGGKLPYEMEIHEFAAYAKTKLGVSYGLLIAKGKERVSNVALIGGGGWQENELAQLDGYDVYISGDMPHHARREVVLRHYNYLDLPHEIEKVFMDSFKGILLSIDPKLEVVTVDHEKLPEVI